MINIVMTATTSTIINLPDAVILVFDNVTCLVQKPTAKHLWLSLSGIVLTAPLAFSHHYCLLFLQRRSLQAGAVLIFILHDVARSRDSSKIPAKIPKGARIFVADALASSIDAALTGDQKAWLHFALDAGTSSTSLTAYVKSRVERFADNRNWEFQKTTSIVPRTSYICHTINTRQIAGYVAVAVRIVTPDNCIVEQTPIVLDTLRMKHHSPPHDTRSAQSVLMPTSTDVSTDEVCAVLMSFFPSSAGDINGPRPGHLKDMTSRKIVEANKHLNQSLAVLSTKLLSGDIANQVRNILLSA